MEEKIFSGKRCIYASDGCTNMARVHRPSCTKCGANVGYWDLRVKKEGVEVLRRRKRNLSLYAARMGDVTAVAPKSNVVQMRRRKTG
jgi:hypothetical protein